MFLLLSFVIAFAIFSNVFAHPGSSATKSSYVTFTSYASDALTTDAIPLYVQAAKTSTFAYSGGVYTGPGVLQTASTTYPAPGQIGAVLNTYDLSGGDVSALTTDASPTSQVAVFPEDTFVNWATSFPSTPYSTDNGKFTLSESGLKVPNAPGVLLSFYNNDQKGLDACNDAEGYGASSFSDDSLIGYQWFPTNVCSPYFFPVFHFVDTNFYRTTLNADGTLTIAQYASQSDCDSQSSSTKSLSISTGNALCGVDWAGYNPVVSSFELAPGFSPLTLYHVSAQFTSGAATPKPAPKAKLTKAPTFVKKGKKMAV